MNSVQQPMRTILAANLRHKGGFETRPYKLRCSFRPEFAERLSYGIAPAQAGEEIPITASMNTR
jgi:hypothetical protein